MTLRIVVFITALFTAGLSFTPRAAQAQVPPSPPDTLCDPAYEDCRAKLLQLIRDEYVRIDVAFWFMEDARYTAELKRKVDAGVPVRVLVDTRANASVPANADRLAELAAAGIPMRRRTASGILHWKMMLFSGQNTVQFSAANYSGDAFVYERPYDDYIDEVIYFTADPVVVNSFRTKYDDLWTNTTEYVDYKNITAPLERAHGIFPKDPELNFVPAEHYRNRAVKRYDAENVGIDVVMYRITDQHHTNAMIRAVQRGVPVRVLTEQKQYRDPSRLWHSWNVDRLYMAGVQVRHRGHLGLNHQKSVILHQQQLTIFGSSNWTSPSASSQEEHNYFTYKPYFYQWFTDQFNRKWNNTAPLPESQPFVPLPPDKPAYLAPSDFATNQGTDSVTLRWHGGPWAHLYDVYFGTTSNPPLFASDLPLGPSERSSENQEYVVFNLTPGTTYYWRVVAKTMALVENTGPIRTFTTAGEAPPPPASAALGPGDILLYASRGTTQGGWSAVSDSLAAGGMRMASVDAGQPKVSTAAAFPADYFELTFTAEAGRPYRIWMRGLAQGNHYSNDSVHVQFSGSVNSTGAPVWRIGTTSSTVLSVERGSGAGVSGWGWEDNGWDSLGPTVQFAESGQQTIRIQRREDGISIDQVLLSPEAFMTTAPGAAKMDTTIYPEFDGSGTEPLPPPPPPPPPPPTSSDPLEQVLHVTGASITGADWQLIADPSAASGTRLENTDFGRSKASTASAAPESYVEFSFMAEANTPYRLWLRLRAAGDKYSNDSLHVQFSGAVDVNRLPIARIGSTSSEAVNLEDCSGCGLSGWGWQDNGWGTGVMGPVIYFAEAGLQTLRLQRREDGVSVDQIVLSASRFLNSPPGPLKNDSTLLAETSTEEESPTDPEEPPADGPTDPEEPPSEVAAGELVLHASRAVITGTGWQAIPDAMAAGGVAIYSTDNQAAKVKTALAEPASYVELPFTAEPGRAYRLWVRMRAQDDYWGNDSIHVQFSGSLDESAQPAYRIGTTSAVESNLEDCSGCGLSGWGWQDNGWGVGVLGPRIYFASEEQTMRIQVREDGVRIDQIVLSPMEYLSSAPGALKNDTTILPESAGESD